jgi:CRISPR type III-B/RAMP module RAMP protein Cmr1
MEEAIFKVEIITPTIMGGANSGNLDSILIRPTEIKSAMRQAFRLIAGKYIEHDYKKIKDLYDLESEIFGNTEGKGKFRLIVDVPSELEHKEVKLLPHKSGISKSAILSNQTFDLKIISYKYPVEFYKALLNIAFLLGVGYKRNRLFGNMQIEKFELKDEVGKIEKFFLDKGYREIKTDNPLFACFSKREDNDKNFLVYGMPLKDEFNPSDVKNFQYILEKLYKEVIHKIKGEKLDFILGGVNPRRQASFVNFSILKVGQSYRLFVIGFYYKNEKFKYNDWKNAIEKAKELSEKTFKK